MPTYQGGGLILPQYSGAQQSYALPGSGMQTLNAFMQIDQQSQQRYMQQQQLNMQRSQQTQNMINGGIEMQLRRSQQERVNKQIDLQNKKFEFEQLQSGIKMQEEALAWGENEFIGGDQDKFNAQVKSLNDKIANLDSRDVMEIAKSKREKQMLARTFENGYKNKADFLKAAAILKDNPNDAVIKDAIDKGYGDYDAINKYQTAGKEYYKNLDAFYKTGDRTYLDAANKIAPDIATLGDFVNEDIQTRLHAAKISEQMAKASSAESTAILNNAKAQELKATLPHTLKQLELDGKIGEQENKLITQAYEDFFKTNPNPTIEQINEFKQGILGKYNQNKNQYNSSEQMYAEGYRTNDPGMMDAAMQWKLADNNKTTNVNYTTDGRGIIDKDGSINYGGYGINKDNTWAWGIYGGNQIKRDQIKDEIESGTVIPQEDGSLKITDDASVMKIFGIKSTWGSFDSGDIKTAIPGAKKVGGSWIIPKDNVALPQQTNTSGGYFNSPQAAPPATSGKQW